MALHRAVGAGAGAHEFVDFLHLDDVAFEPGDFGDRGDLALAVGLTLQLHDQLDGAGDLAADARHRHRQPGHADHLLHAGNGVARRIGVDGSHRAFVAGVHGLEHVEGFLAAALAENDAIGPHAQRVLDQFTLTDFALAFDIGRTRFHAADMRLLQLQFGGVLDGDQAFLLRDEGGERVEHRRFAGTGAAGNDSGDARPHRRRQHLGHRRAQRADLDQLAEVQRLLGKLADRHQRAVDADRPHRDVDAASILQACVAERMRLIDAAADRGDNFIDDAQEMLLILEAHRKRFEDAAALHIDAFVAVDEDIVDAFVLEQRFERAEARHLVEDFRDEIGKFLRIECQPFGHHVFSDQCLHVCADFVFGQLFQRREIDFFDQPPVQTHLGVEQLVAQQWIDRRRDRRRRRLRRDRRGVRRHAGRRLDRQRLVMRGNPSGGKSTGHRVSLL